MGIIRLAVAGKISIVIADFLGNPGADWGYFCVDCQTKILGPLSAATGWTGECFYGVNFPDFCGNGGMVPHRSANRAVVCRGADAQKGVMPWRYAWAGPGVMSAGT